jgi:signal transduction histidine kinase
MAALLVVLATLQYTWLGRLSSAERGRLRSGLDHAASRFCDDVDRELLRAFVTFMPVLRPEETPVEQRLIRQARRWRAEAPYPELVRAVTLVEAGGGASERVECLDWSTFTLHPCAWPTAFVGVRDAIEAARPVPPFPEGVSGLVLEPRRFPRGAPGEERRAPGNVRPVADILITLDQTFVTRQMLPKLSSVYFTGSSGLDYSVVVVDRAAPATVLFRSGPHGSTDIADKDVVRPFFTLRPFRGPVAEAMERGAGWRDDEPPGPGDHGPPPTEPLHGPEEDGGRAGIHGGGRWLLLVSHPAGSLDAAVEGARVRNLAIGLFILALLGASAVLVVVSSQRAQKLARQQLNFVAAVSHELRTPLTAICSAGQNLADGVVAEGEQVRRYGSLIAGEGRRLSEIVSRVLDFAGIRSGQRTYHFQPVDLAAVVTGVVASVRHHLEEKGVHLEVQVTDRLPGLSGDAGALRQVLHNLLDNAVKFGGAARWVGVRLTEAEGPRGTELSMAVSDRGAGIKKSDLGRIFEPFDRGSSPAAAAVPGSGLGLALVRHIVKAHGGRVIVHSTPGEGSTFEVLLPVPRAAEGGVPS